VTRFSGFNCLVCRFPDLTYGKIAKTKSVSFNPTHSFAWLRTDENQRGCNLRLKLIVDEALEDEIHAESDRKLALPLLHRLDRELIRRGDMYRKLGVRDVAGYRNSEGAPRLPGMVLEVHELRKYVSIDDRFTLEVSLLLDRLVRQGEAFDIYVKLH